MLPLTMWDDDEEEDMRSSELARHCQRCRDGDCMTHGTERDPWEGEDR